MKEFSRRDTLIGGFASLLALGAQSAHAAPASVPVIWDGKKMYESFAKEGTGISSKGPAGRPKAYVAFDTQCRDCWQLHRRSGCRAVPYGVFKNSKGQYLPFDERLTVEELKQLFEL